MNRLDVAEERFERLFSTYAGRVLAYALRRIDADAAQDVTADVFAVAWRRIDSVPHEEALPWLLAVARRTLANKHRSARRQRALVDRLQLSMPAPQGPDIAASASGVLEALASLADRDREVLMLIAWDGLASAEAAVVLGCSPVACRIRLHRARSRLRRAMDRSSNVESDRLPLCPQRMKETPDA